MLNHCFSSLGLHRGQKFHCHFWSLASFLPIYRKKLGEKLLWLSKCRWLVEQDLSISIFASTWHAWFCALSGLSIRARGRGFSPATKRVTSGYFYWQNRRKIEPKEIPSRLIPRLLVVFTRQLEILVTTLIVVWPVWLNHAQLGMVWEISFPYTG